MDSLSIDLPLKDIHLPPPVGWWPPAIGWWLLALSSIALGYAAYRLWRLQRRLNPRRLGLNELSRLEADTGLAPLDKVQQLSMLLRRVALSVQARSEVAGLQGADWLRWLDQRLHDGRFTTGPGQVLAAAPYHAEPLSPEELQALFALCRDWLERTPSRP